MKNFICSTIVGIIFAVILINLSNSFDTYTIGDSQKMKGVNLQVVNVETSSDYDIDGWYITVYFTIENTRSEPYYLNYLHFTLNDGYTIQESYISNIKSGGFELIKGVKHDFYVTFITKYRHDENEMIFIWEENGLFNSKKEWVV